MQDGLMLVNESQNIVIASRVTIAKTFGARLRGLMDRRRIDFPDGSALIIIPCKQVHTWFMRFPIDLLFVDKDDTIVSALSQVQPYKVSRYVSASYMVVELPPGTINTTGTREKDKINIYRPEVSA